MAHNLHGDVSKEDLALAEELLEMESHFRINADIYGASQCARIFVCISHDWYELGDDDKGRQLLEKADKICPGYFDDQIQKHIEEDPDFDYLVQNLAAQILAVARSVVG
jgi:hypothetical protein